MFQIQNLTNDTRQNMTLVLDDGSTVQMSIYFSPMQYGWFITSLTYENFVIQGLRICNLPNILYQFKNQIPFGLACFSNSAREPSQQQDFSSGASTLYILSAAEVAAYSEYLSGQ